MRVYKCDAPVKGNQDSWFVGTMGEFSEFALTVSKTTRERKRCTASCAWSGSKDYDVSADQVRSGDLSAVAPSDKWLDKFENMIPQTKAWQVRHDVLGGVPNVPAFLAGHPMNMRRRERITKESAPLCVMVTLTTSAAITADLMRKRGAILLAFVRALSATRPVELWACNSVGSYGVAGNVLIQIDTNPLDLARAAHVLTCPSVARGLGYAVAYKLMKEQLDYNWIDGWPYGNHSEFLRTCRENYGRQINPTAEALLIPAAHIDDPMVQKPDQWFRDMLTKYGGIEQD